MHELVALHHTSIKLHAPDVDLTAACTLRHNAQRSPIRQFHAHIAKSWRSEPVLWDAWTHLVKAESAQDVPCTHLPRIVVACQSVRPVPIFTLHECADPLLRLPGCSGR